MVEISNEPTQAGDEAAIGQVQLWETLSGFINSAVLGCMIQMRLPSIIHAHGGRMGFDRLASELGIASPNRDRLRRILRHLVHMNLLRMVEENGLCEYGLTPASKLLVQGQEKSLEAFFGFVLEHDAVPFMGGLCSNLQNEDDWWNRVEEDPEANAGFMRSMDSYTGMLMNEVLRIMVESRALDGLETLVDVGGNTGQVAGAIIKAFPHMKCCVLELPNVVDAITEPHPMVSIIPGNMFESIPKADVVFMKSIQHGFNDEDCIKILRKCKEAIPADRGKVIFAEIILDAKATVGLAAARMWMDMMMMPPAGKERTEEEWHKIITGAGFSNYKITAMEANESFFCLYP